MWSGENPWGSLLCIQIRILSPKAFVFMRKAFIAVVDVCEAVLHVAVISLRAFVHGMFASLGINSSILKICSYS